ncbi:MAG: hypothetical protein LBF88_02470, partial [Planctomycetaceae bacterium]|nr:hypothetical protein [Planctomycetaceae bacterium]
MFWELLKTCFIKTLPLKNKDDGQILQMKYKVFRSSHCYFVCNYSVVFPHILRLNLTQNPKKDEEKGERRILL